ncbi:MAG: Fic family protein [Solirubrobacterales bacterium]
MATRRQASKRSGEFRAIESGPDGYSAFHPAPLPPEPAIDVNAGLQALLDEANQALGRLDGITLLLPDPDKFLYTYVRKEAVLSSQIEGTQSSLSDLLLFEADAAPGVPVSDARETSNYIAAMDYGVEMIRKGELPLCNRLFREMHALLLQSGRGSERSPGRFRREQNWIGGNRPSVARYVPPPWQEVEPAMAKLEKFLHDEPERTPILLKAALAHAQFETIHPFLDGNGRVGRLLITLLVVAEGVLTRPLLYLSLYLKQNRDDYYDHLQRIRTEGAWEDWLRFFLEGIIEVAESTTATTRHLVDMIERDRQAIHEFGRAAATALRVHDLASRLVVIRPTTASSLLQLSDPPVYAAVKRLEEAGILREVTGRRRGKLYVYDEYLARLNEGTTEPA